MSTLPTRKLCLFVLGAFIALMVTRAATSADISKPPVAAKRPVSTEYHGVKVTEDYRWLEDFNDPEVKQWVAQENEYSRHYFDSLPFRNPIRDRIKELLSKSSPRWSGLVYRHGSFFARKFDPQREQPVLVSFKSLDDRSSETVLLDPAQLEQKGLAMDWFFPSLDGKLVAVAMSAGGSEDASLYILDVASRRLRDEVVPRVNYATAGGGMAWTSDGSGFHYTRYLQENERPKEDLHFYQQIYFHKLGTAPSSDKYVLGKDFPRIVEITLDAQGDGKYLLATVENGDGGEFEHFVLTPAGDWKQISHFEDRVISATVGRDGYIYLLSRKNAPRGQVLRIPVSEPSLSAAKIVVPQQEGSIENAGSSGGVEYRTILPTANRLYVLRINGGPNELDAYDLQGRPLGTVPIPPVSSVDQVIALEGDEIAYRATTFTTPSAWYRYTGSGTPTKTAFYETSSADFSDAQVERAYATSKDGTRVPMTIVYRKGTKLDGSNPAILYGYGGYDISESPFFLDWNGRVWLDQGGIYVDANLRGGGEFGEEWHQAGMLTKKQNVFDDFVACAQYLIQKRYTSPAHLVAEGGSNGGLLMGAELTQHPDLFRAVVSYVGIYDMLRVELDPNGSFNTTEYGTVKDPELFRALYAYSPYHHVKDGTAYPAVLFVTGDNDARVNPAHSRKMTARLQAATSSGRPILLRTSSNAGHGFGTALSERIEQAADVTSFVFDQLGIKYSGAEQASRK